MESDRPFYTSLHVLVLAAGASTRLGQPKQLVLLDGQPALSITVANAVAIAGHAVTVVIGAHADMLTHLLAHSPASVIVNPDWQEGLGASIRRGMAALPLSCSAVMIVLGDQVAVCAEDLRRLRNAWGEQEETIAAATYAGHVGVPAIFPQPCFGELRELKGDRGARAVLEHHRSRVVHVPMPNAAIDLDTPADLAALARHFHIGEP